MLATFIMVAFGWLSKSQCIDFLVSAQKLCADVYGWLVDTDDLFANNITIRCGVHANSLCIAPFVESTWSRDKL